MAIQCFEMAIQSCGFGHPVGNHAGIVLERQFVDARLLGSGIILKQLLIHSCWISVFNLIRCRGEYPYCAPLSGNASCVETYIQLHMKCGLVQSLDILVANWHPYLMITGMVLFWQAFSETLAKGAIRHSVPALRHGRAHLAGFNDNAFLRYN